jgi:hypothetical protein
VNVRRRSVCFVIGMERLLSAVNQAAAEAGVGVPGESLLGTIKIAVLPIAKVFTMCFLGFLMASKYVNILPANGRKLLNGVCQFLLLLQVPTLQIIFSISKIEKLTHCFPLLCHAVGLFTFASLFDILSTWSSCHHRENA